VLVVYREGSFSFGFFFIFSLPAKSPPRLSFFFFFFSPYSFSVSPSESCRLERAEKSVSFLVVVEGEENANVHTLISSQRVYL